MARTKQRSKKNATSRAGLNWSSDKATKEYNVGKFVFVSSAEKGTKKRAGSSIINALIRDHEKGIDTVYVPNPEYNIAGTVDDVLAALRNQFNSSDKKQDQKYKDKINEAIVNGFTYESIEEREDEIKAIQNEYSARAKNLTEIKQSPTPAEIMYAANLIRLAKKNSRKTTVRDSDGRSPVQKAAGEKNRRPLMERIQKARDTNQGITLFDFDQGKPVGFGKGEKSAAFVLKADGLIFKAYNTAEVDAFLTKWKSQNPGNNSFDGLAKQIRRVDTDGNHRFRNRKEGKARSRSVSRSTSRSSRAASTSRSATPSSRSASRSRSPVSRKGGRTPSAIPSRSGSRAGSAVSIPNSKNSKLQEETIYDDDEQEPVEEGEFEEEEESREEEEKEESEESEEEIVLPIRRTSRSPMNRGSGSRSPMNRGSGSRSPMNRGSGSRSPMNRGSGSRSPMNRPASGSRSPRNSNTSSRVFEPEFDEANLEEVAPTEEPEEEEVLTTAARNRSRSPTAKTKTTGTGGSTRIGTLNRGKNVVRRSDLL